MASLNHRMRPDIDELVSVWSELNGLNLLQINVIKWCQCEDHDAPSEAEVSSSQSFERRNILKERTSALANYKH